MEVGIIVAMIWSELPKNTSPAPSWIAPSAWATHT